LDQDIFFKVFLQSLSSMESPLSLAMNWKKGAVFKRRLTWRERRLGRNEIQNENGQVLGEFEVACTSFCDTFWE